MEGSAPRDNRSSEAVIEAVGLTKAYGNRTVVDDLHLRVNRGSIFGLLGPNGAGKTTTILMLLGLTDPNSGHATVLGLDPQRDSLKIKQRVGYLPDDVGFYPNLTARENLEYTAQLNRLPRNQIGSTVSELLGEVGLSGASGQKVGGFSRGMRQRLGLADALVKRPEILVLDEPTVNIDPVGVREINQLVRRLQSERGLTVLLSSHLLSQVQELCDEVAIFVDGRVVVQGEVDALTLEAGDKRVIELESVSSDTAAVRECIESVLVSAPTSELIHLGGTVWRIIAAGDHRSTLVRALTISGLGVNTIGWVHASLDDTYAKYFVGRHPVEAPK